MISCIICSRTKDISQTLKQNIAETIGLDYELIVIDNSQNDYSIFSAYNEGVRRAKGGILCFMHEDVWYNSGNWGAQVEHLCKDSQIGCVGIIGSYFLPQKSGYWHDMTPYKTGFVSMGNNYVHNANQYYDKNSSSEVAMVDGMWFCIPKSMFQTISFDEQTYQGFHWYDMDICMQVLQARKKIMILRDADIWHLSHPKANLLFIQNMEKFYRKWEAFLPISRGVAVDDLNSQIIQAWCLEYYNQKKIFLEYQERIENSLSYKIGNAIAEPYRKIMRCFKR